MALQVTPLLAFSSAVTLVGVVVHYFYAECGYHCLPAIRVVKAIHNNVCALGSQGFGDAHTAAAGGAGDEGCFAFEHGVSFSV